MYQFARAAITKYYRLGRLNSDLFSHNSGGWKSKVWLPARLSSGENPLPGLHRAAFLLCAHMAFPQCVHTHRENSSISSSSYKGTSSIRSGLCRYDLT